MRELSVGDLVKINDIEKNQWVKHNPWMAIKWGLHTVYIITDIKTTATKKPVSLYKIVDTESGDYKWAKADEVEVISESH